MAQKFKKSDNEVEEVVQKYGSIIFRISYCILCNVQDAEDAVQETFLKYMTKSPEFVSEEHRKAWLIKVSTNISKNMLMFRIRREALNIDDVINIGIPQDDISIFEMIMSIPTKYKIVMTLYYVEGYRSKEIAEILDINEAAVRKRLQRGRELLKKEFEKESLL